MIMSLLKAVPRWLWFTLAGALIVAVLLASVNLYGSNREAKGYSSGYDKRSAEIDKATADKNAENRQKEQQLNDQIADLQQNNQQLKNQLDADKRSANQRVNAFSMQLEQTRRILADAAGSADPGISAAGKTALQTAGMLTVVLGKSLERNRILAAYADDASAAGQLCENQYDTVRLKLNDK